CVCSSDLEVFVSTPRGPDEKTSSVDAGAGLCRASVVRPGRAASRRTLQLAADGAGDRGSLPANVCSSVWRVTCAAAPQVKLAARRGPDPDVEAETSALARSKPAAIDPMSRGSTSTPASPTISGSEPRLLATTGATQ